MPYWGPWINILDYGADPTQQADSTFAFSYARSQLGANPGVIYVPAGNYQCTGVCGLIQGQSLIGDGAAVTSIYYTGNGPAIQMSLQGNFTGGAYAGRLEGFYLDGYHAGGSADGILAGDLQGIRIQDVEVAGFGGAGWHGKNGTNRWSEEQNVEIRLVGNGTAALFDHNSFDYSDFNFTIVSAAGGNGVVLENGAQVQGGRMRIRGNFVCATPNTAAVLAIDPGNVNGTSVMVNASVDFAAETAGTGTGPFTILLGGTTSTCQFSGTGVMDFANVTENFQGASIPGSAIFGFSGILNDQTLGTLTPGDCLVVNGGSHWAAPGSLTLNPFGNLYFQFGDVYEFRLNNGNNSLTFHGASNYTKRVDLWIAQPATGAAGTISWPANVKWASASAPTLSSVNGYVDHVRLTYLPDTASWYGELSGVHFA